MDIIDQIEIPSFERKNASLKRNFAVAAGCVGLLYALEQYNGSVSRSWKSVRRGVTAAIAAWLEDHRGFPLFSIDGEEVPPLSQSVLDFNGLCAPRLTHGGGTTAAAAAFLTQNTQQDVIGVDPTDDPNAPSALSAHLFASADTPNFFQSTKFFACLDVEEARELFRATRRISLAPHEVLFRSGDPSDSGIYIVLHGTLGVFLEDPTHNTPPIHANTLRSGESVGDLDVVDGAVRTVSCMALESGCLLVNVPRELFMDFVHSHPRALMLYLQQGLARLWRVAHFVLADFLQLQLYRPKPPGSALAAETAAAAAAGTPVRPVRTLSNLFGHEVGTQTEFPPPPMPSAPPPGSPPLSPTPARAPSPVAPEQATVTVTPPTAEAAVAAATPSCTAGDGIDAAREPPVPIPELAAGRQSSAGGSSSNGEGDGKSRRGRKSKRCKAQAAAVAAAAPAAEKLAGIASPAGTLVTGGAAIAAAAALAPMGPLAEGELHVEVSFSDQAADEPPAAELDAVSTAELGRAPSSTSAGAGSLAPGPSPLIATQPSYSPYASPRATLTGSTSPEPSAPTFNELLASAAASARARGAGGPTHGPLRPEAPAAPTAKAAAVAAAALLANVPAGGTPMPDVPSDPAAACTAALEGGRGGAVPVPIPARKMRSPSASLTALAGSGDGTASVTSVSANASTSTISSMATVSMSPGTAPMTARSSLGVGGGGGGGNGGPRGMAGVLPPRYSNNAPRDEGPRPQGPVCRLLPGRSQSMRRSFVLGERACLAAGWDVIDVEELTFDDNMWATLSDPRSGVGSQLPLAAGGMLQDVDWASGCFYLLLDGHLLAERPACPPGGPEDSGVGGAPGPGGLPARAAAVQESALIAPGSLISCAAFLSSTASRCKVVALEPSRLVAFSWQTLEALVAEDPDLLIRLLVAASAALGPVIRRFISLGLNRVWLESGDVAYRQGDYAECLYVVISGRLRLLHETFHPVTQARQLHLEEEVGRGEAVGAVWAITGGHHDTTALCVRDSELVRMSRSAFRVISADSPLALSKLFSNIARRLVAAWDSRVRSDRGASSPNAAASANAANAAAGVAGLQQLPNPARLGLTPLKSAGQLAAGGGVVRGPRPSGRRGEIVTIAILPAGILPEAAAFSTMASALAGSPNDVAAAAAALAAGEAASMGDGSGGGSSGTGRAGSYSALLGSSSGSGSWRWPPGMSKQAAALATLTAIKRLSGALKDALSPFGPVLLLDATVLSLQFPTASERLDVLFYRSKVTSWMAAQEEEYRFILLEADVAASPWSSVCVAQADCILLVAPEGSSPQLSQPESLLVFNAASPAFARPKSMRSGLTPAFATPAASMTPAPSSAHLAATAAAGAAGAARASPSRFNSMSVGPGKGGSERGKAEDTTAAGGGGDGGGAPSPPSNASSASLASAAAALATAAVVAAAAPPPPPVGAAAATGIPGGVGGSHHPHHQRYGMAQQMYGASSAAMLRRVELVLLHRGDGTTPCGTAEWLAGRPNLSRHHHIRLGRPTDIQRLARWMAGKTVGIVLSGGGSRGLAHLGVLTALEDAGVPVDAVGGTSQGAFMAALYAQGLGREALNHSVRHYAQQLSSVRHLLSDITLPVLSVFSGGGFDQAVRRVFERGAQRLEDLWLPYFCVTTNLTHGEASVHTEGVLWKLVRASMTIVGLLPPVWEDGCLLVDGGYLNSMPVDVMRSMMGVDSVLVVDVEGRDDMGWRSLTPYDGGISGWRLLWDRICPFPRWRSAAAPPPGSAAGASRGPPRYAALINKLTTMIHSSNLKRVAMEHRIDLYLRPPGRAGGYRLMDYHLMDRIVKDAYRYATSAINQWKATRRVGPFGIEENPAAAQPAAAAMAAPGQVEVIPVASAGAVGGPAPVVLPQPGASSTSISGPAGVGVGAGAAAAGSSATGPVPSCMTQLQKKQQPPAAVLAAVTASVGGTVPPGGVPFGSAGAAATAAPPSRPPAAGQGRPAAAAFACTAPVVGVPTSPPVTPLLGSKPPPVSALRTASATAAAGGGRERRSVDFVTPTAASAEAAAAAAATSLVSAGGVAAAAAAGGPDEGGQQQQAQGADSVVGSPPSPPLRHVMSKMSRSATKHSLLDLDP